MIWVVVYLALGLVLVFRGVVPMLQTWRMNDPKFLAKQVPASRSTAFSASERALLAEQGFVDRDVHEISIGRKRLLVHLWIRRPGDNTLCASISRLDGSKPRRLLSSFVGRSLGRVETRDTQDLPVATGEVAQVVPGADFHALMYHHDQALRRLNDYGLEAGPVVQLDGLGMLRQQMMGVRSHLSRHPLSWFWAQLLNNVKPVTADLLADDPDLQRRLQRSGLLLAPAS